MINSIVEKYFSEEILQEACSKYELQLANIKLIRGYSNLIYECGDKILRLSHSELRTYEEIEPEIDWIEFLSLNKVSVVKVIPSKNNLKIERIGDIEHFTIVCFEKINGNKIQSENWNKLHFEKLGNLIGQLHRIGQQYEKKINLNYKHWNEIIEYENHSYLAYKKQEYIEIHDHLVQEFNTYKITKSNYGLVHYDVHQGNYLMTQKKQNIVLFDFEMICQSWYVNDISSAMYYAIKFPANGNEEEFKHHFFDCFWSGYEKEKFIEEDEKLKIPKFLLYRDLLVLSFVTKMWNFKMLTNFQKSYIARIEDSISKRKLIL